ncbi:hypothetical protein [Candidatus Amarobacter glycogenicus]|uniref:hypothetical protein n=1 Tax=Candidatus Amarobacter glycogenicus TaxID=3140699 RepID=UPI002A0E6234|nr:hypothetical protein [Dehalococcoidia bacterium]
MNTCRAARKATGAAFRWIEAKGQPYQWLATPLHESCRYPQNRGAPMSIIRLSVGD